MAGPCELYSDIKINCPECGRVTITPDMYTGYNPISGICPRCNHRLFFDHPDLPPNTVVRSYIGSFVPDSLNQGSPTAEISITPVDH